MFNCAENFRAFRVWFHCLLRRLGHSFLTSCFSAFEVSKIARISLTISKIWKRKWIKGEWEWKIVLLKGNLTTNELAFEKFNASLVSKIMKMKYFSRSKMLFLRQQQLCHWYTWNKCNIGSKSVEIACDRLGSLAMHWVIPSRYEEKLYIGIRGYFPNTL